MSGSSGGGFGQQGGGQQFNMWQGQQPQFGQPIPQLNGWQQSPLNGNLGSPGTGSGLINMPNNSPSPGNLGPGDPGSYAPPPGYQQPTMGASPPNAFNPQPQQQTPMQGGFFTGGSPNFNEQSGWRFR
jgi:hypothetical protein